jgi:hypothetical protein
MTGLSALAFSWWSFAVLRFMVGVAVGSEWATGSSMMAELWPDRARGKGGGTHAVRPWHRLLYRLSGPALHRLFRRSNQKISRSQWLPTPRRPQSGRSVTSPTRLPLARMARTIMRLRPI